MPGPTNDITQPRDAAGVDDRPFSAPLPVAPRLGDVVRELWNDEASGDSFIEASFNTLAAQASRILEGHSNHRLDTRILKG
ncbi:MAG: hypothetical protein KDD53_01445, partial [Bdellovibrionales bacterium]|nr:hypothetical protein [Bdellovibrionales bacterium]